MAIGSGLQRRLGKSYSLRHVDAPQPMAHIRLLGSGTILREVLSAADVLAREHGISSEVFSVTSFSELARDARDQQRIDRLDPQAGGPRPGHVTRLLSGDAPVLAVTDYVRAWPQLIAEYVQARYVTLGTDGFGRSDTRQQLRRHFEVDAASIVRAALHVLVQEGLIGLSAMKALVDRRSEAAGASWSC